MKPTVCRASRAFAPIVLAAALAACSGEVPGGDTQPMPIAQPALAGATSIRDVSVEEASALITNDPDVVVMDVRTPAEFAEGHIDGAINLDAMSDSFIKDLAKLNKDAAYVLHCRSGRRSAKALEAMKEAGFEDIAHMDAGMIGWNEADLLTTP